MDKAYHILREAILTGELKPGEQLTEEALSRLAKLEEL